MFHASQRIYFNLLKVNLILGVKNEEECTQKYFADKKSGKFGEFQNVPVFLRLDSENKECNEHVIIVFQYRSTVDSHRPSLLQNGYSLKHRQKLVEKFVHLYIFHMGKITSFSNLRQRGLNYQPIHILFVRFTSISMTIPPMQFIRMTFRMLWASTIMQRLASILT